MRHTIKAVGAEGLNFTVWRFNDSVRALCEGLDYEDPWSWMEKKR